MTISIETLRYVAAMLRDLADLIDPVTDPDGS